MPREATHLSYIEFPQNREESDSPRVFEPRYNQVISTSLFFVHQRITFLWLVERGRNDGSWEVVLLAKLQKARIENSCSRG